MVRIDGDYFDIPVAELSVTGEFPEKFRATVETGSEVREIYGTYLAYQLRFGASENTSEYQRLWDKVSEPVNYHTIAIPAGGSEVTFEAMFEGFDDSLLARKDNKHYWIGMTLKFRSRVPVRK